MITKTVIGLSALVSAGFIASVDPMSRPADAPAKFTDRFPTIEELMLAPTELHRIPVLTARAEPSARPAAPAPGPQAVPAPQAAAPKADKQAVSRPTGCEAQTWPYIGKECLTSIDGTPVRAPARTITIERRFQGGSILVQAEVSELVAR
jgi:hypothetical protein